MPKRKSRAGESKKPSGGHYVRSNRPDGCGDRNAGDYDVDQEVTTHATRKPVTLPELQFLKPKKVGGEWIK